MPLIQCTDCLGQVSDRAFDCPHCGAHLRDRPRSKNSGCGIIIAIVIAFIAGGLVVLCAQENALSSNLDLINSQEHSSPTPDVAAIIRDAIAATESDTAIASSESTSVFAYGPISGTLEHEAGSGYVVVDSFSDLTDFVVEATFTEPDVVVGDPWAGGFLFRVTGAENNDIIEGHAIYFGDANLWGHIVCREKVCERVREESSAAMNGGSGSENHVSITVLGSEGSLYINGVLEATLDLTDAMESGSVLLFGNAEAGSSPTRYSDFSVISLEER